MENDSYKNYRSKHMRPIHLETPYITLANRFLFWKISLTYSEIILLTLRLLMGVTLLILYDTVNLHYINFLMSHEHTSVTGLKIKFNQENSCLENRKVFEMAFHIFIEPNKQYNVNKQLRYSFFKKIHFIVVKISR